MAVIIQFFNAIKRFLSTIIMGNCCRRKSSIGPLSVLLLGSEGSGKTEIGHVFSHEPRIDFTSTKGARVFNVHSKSQRIKLTEIGGSDSVRDIWPHYYNDAFGIVFVIDCSLNAPFDAIREMLHRTMYHKNIRGKPLLIVANKQDLDQSIDVVDITYFFRIDEICNLLSTPCLIITSGMGNRTDLKDGMDWLVESIIENHNTLKNRMRFNGLLSPITRFKRQRTSLPRKGMRKVYAKRIKSAPSAFVSRQISKANGHVVTSAVKQLDRIQYFKAGREPNLFKLNPIVVQHV